MKKPAKSKTKKAAKKAVKKKPAAKAAKKKPAAKKAAPKKAKAAKKVSASKKAKPSSKAPKRRDKERDDFNAMPVADDLTDDAPMELADAHEEENVSMDDDFKGFDEHAPIDTDDDDDDF